MAAKDKNKLSDKEVERLRKVLGESSDGSSQAIDRARESKGFKASIKAYRDTAKKERIAKTGYKTSKGDFFRGAGFENLGDFVEKMFDKKASKEEVDDAKSSLGYKAPKVTGAGFSLSTSKELLKRFNAVSANVAAIRKDVAYIKDRVSPKQFTAKSGEKTQRVQYDPFAPEGEKYRRVNEKGTVTALRIGKEFQKSATLKATSAVHKNPELDTVIDKAVTKTAGRLSKKNAPKFVDPSEKDVFAKDPMMAIMNKMSMMDAKLDSIMKMRGTGDNGEGGGPDIPGKPGLAQRGLNGLKKAGSAVANAARWLTTGAGEAAGMTAVGVGASAAVIYGTKRMMGDVQKEQADKMNTVGKEYGIKINWDKKNPAVPMAESFEIGGKKYEQFDDLPVEYQNVIRANSGERNVYADKAKADIKARPDVYAKLKENAKSGKTPAATWDDLEKELQEWLRQSFPERAASKLAADSYLGYFDSLKKAGGDPPTLSDLVNGAMQKVGAPYPGTGPSVEAPPPPMPKAAAPAAAAAPAPSAVSKPSTAAAPAPSAVSKPSTAAAPASSAAPAAGGATGTLAKKKEDTGFMSMIKGAMQEAGLVNEFGQIALLANIKKETNFKLNPENLNYTSVERIRKVFPGMTKALSDEEISSKYVKNPEALAELVYGYQSKLGPGMGNTEPGDGWKYRGRGFIQLTGKSNYERYGKMIDVDLVKNPDAANDPVVAAKIAARFVMTGLKNKLDFTSQSDANRAVTQTIGGNGLNLDKGIGAELLAKVDSYSGGFSGGGGSFGGGGASGSWRPSSGTVSSTQSASPSSGTVSPTGSASPTPSKSGAVIDTGSKQVSAGKEAAMQSSAPVVVNNTTAAPASAAPQSKEKLPSAGTRSSDSSFNRALAKDFSHPTAFTTVGTI